MMNYLFRIEKRILILIFAAILIFGNYFYFEYIFKPSLITYKNFQLKKILNDINLEILKFNNFIVIFNRLKKAKIEFEKEKYRIKMIKLKAKSKSNLLPIIRTLILENNIKLNELQLTGTDIKNNMEIISFNFKGKSKLKNFIEFLDNLENKNNIIIVDKYKLSRMDTTNIFKIDMDLKSIFLRLNENEAN